MRATPDRGGTAFIPKRSELDAAFVDPEIEYMHKTAITARCAVAMPDRLNPCVRHHLLITLLGTREHLARHPCRLNHRRHKLHVYGISCRAKSARGT